MRQSIVKSACISGLDITSPDVEVTVSSGLPYYRVVGLGDSAVRESGQRVKLALKSSGFRWPDRKITVNLSPAWMNKKGSAFDLPIALGILQAQGEIHPDLKLSAWGELGSDGKIKTVPSALCYADALAGDPERIVIQPEEAEAVLRPYHRGGLYAAHLNEIKALLQEEALEHYQAYELKRHPGEGFFRQERGEEEKFPLHLQEAAWRAVMISAAREVPDAGRCCRLRQNHFGPGRPVSFASAERRGLICLCLKPCAGGSFGVRSEYFFIRAFPGAASFRDGGRSLGREQTLSRRGGSLGGLRISLPG